MNMLTFIFLCSLMLFLPLQARRVLPGEMLWNMEQLMTEASYDVAISQDNMPLTITTSGTYTFAQPLTGNITIAANNVVINLNGHSLNGNISTNGFFNIILRNGFINQPAAASCVDVDNGTNICIEDISFTNGTVGIDFSTTNSNVIINNCTFAKHVGKGIALNNVRVAQVTNCTLNDIAFGGSVSAVGILELRSCEDIYCENISISNNVLNAPTCGILLIDVFSTKCVNCRITNNTASTSSTGILISNNLTPSGSIVLDTCEISNNTTQNIGILMQGGAAIRDVSIRNCLIQNNSDTLYTAIAGVGLEDSVIENCKIMQNTASLGASDGINLFFCFRVTISKNFITNNSGDASSSGIINNFVSEDNLIINNQVRNNSGRGIVQAGTSAYFLGNISSGNAVSNYDNVPAGTVNIVTYDISAGTYNVTPVKTSNIDAIP